jgi:HK97 gp10 family phage protein
MADSILIGRAALNRKLALLPGAFKTVATDILSKAADDIVATMKNFVPVDQGDLRDSIGWTFGDTPKGATAFAKTRPIKSAGGMRITIYAGNDKAFYARFVEFGVLKIGVSAQPFFYPAWRIHKKRLRSRLTRGFNAEAKRIAAL